MNSAMTQANKVAETMINFIGGGNSIHTSYVVSTYGADADVKLLLSVALAERGHKLAADCALAWSGAHTE